jgi:hypothetical protein
LSFRGTVNNGGKKNPARSYPSNKKNSRKT